MTGRASTQQVAAMQSALAAEQAASYAYGVIGAHLPQGARFTAAADDFLAHERARDSLTKMIIAAGARPHPASVAYRLPIDVSSAAQAVLLAAMLEHQIAAAYLGLVALPDPALRTFAADQMQDAAVRAVRWGGHSQAFPGLSG